MRNLPDLSSLSPDDVWYLHLYCGGSYVGPMGIVDIDTCFQNVLDRINALADAKLPRDRPIAFRVKYADPIAWREHIEIETDLDFLDMLLAYKRNYVICIHITYEQANPLMTILPPPPPTEPPLLLTWPASETVTETPLTSPHTLPPQSPPHVTQPSTPPPETVGTESTPVATETVGTESTPPPVVSDGTESTPAAVVSDGTESTPAAYNVGEGTIPPPPTSGSKHNKWTDLKAAARKCHEIPKMTPFTRLLDTPTTSEDSPSDSSDEDGVAPPPAVPIDDETLRRRAAEEQEYYKDADDIYGFGSEDEEWKADSDIEDEGSGDDGWDATGVFDEG